MRASNIKECLINNPMRYRSILTIPRNVKFGLELELENVSLEEVSQLIENHFGDTWQVKTDLSLKRDANAEIVTPPFYNNRQTWLVLKKLGELLKRLKPTFDNCSFQINYDGSLLPTEKDKMKFLKLFAVYEDIIYHFSQGEEKRLRSSVEEYAYPVMLSIKADRESKRYTLEPYTNQKRYGLSFKSNPLDLIEIRSPNATINPIYWQNYICTFYYLIMYSLSPKCNERDLDEYIDRFREINLLDSYSKLNENKAFILSKKLFLKTDDKTHFLNHYLGSKVS